jgi:Ca2+-binding EF-hand superfamily protein
MLSPWLVLSLAPWQDAPPRAQAARTDPVIPIEELSGEERQLALDQLHGRLEVEYFQASDRNANGWISFREANDALGTDRPVFFTFDGDRDGRITRAEFSARYQATVEAVGSFRPPTTTGAKPFPSEDQSPINFDLNGTGALEVGELAAVLDDMGIEVPAPALFSLLDRDSSRALEIAEFAEIAATLSPLIKDALDGAAEPLEPGPPPSTPDDLFGEVLVREDGFGKIPLPDRIAGPVSHFRRLDLDDDGRISEEDLLALLRPSRIEVRPAMVIAALDRDGDGFLSRKELERALGGR